VDDDLLRPSLADRRIDAGRPLPFRLGSQVYVAFFGGALALGAIAGWNSWALEQPRRAQALIAAVALAAEAGLLLVVAFALDGDAGRIAGIGAGLVAYGAAYLIQRSADRVYHYHSREDEPYGSLLGPGIVVVVSARIVESLLIGAVADG
jgi:hypothetical protein